MSSLFNKSGLSSVHLNNNSNLSGTISSNLIPSKASKNQQGSSKSTLPIYNILNESNLLGLSALNLPVKQFSDKLKIQQHQYALSTNNYLKTIDSSLEEASRTGDLLLANKSLIEFPSKIALRYDLTDTLTVDLSKNRLHELPKDLLRFKPLEKLTISSNVIRSIPEIGINQLRCIKILDLNCNRLTYLTPSLCQLVSLEILTVNNNKLVSLPEEIGRLEKLIQLDVSCNEITHLPTQIGDMTSLRSLNIRRNLLVELPREISNLKLVSFDCSSNRISKLPLCFREMVTLIDLTVDNNPLELPPAHICTKGLLHIMKYLLVEAIKDEKRRGVLSEYEINTQMNPLSANTTGTDSKRESCNSSTGLGSIGSFIFQSSVKKMNKKYQSDNLSTQSTTASSSASTVSSSSSVSTSSLSNAKNKLMSNGNQQQGMANSRSSNLTLPSSYQFDQTAKQNQFNNSETVNDSIDPLNSLTSTPSSTTSSSPTTPNQNTQTAQGIITANSNKIVSIHDLISPNKYIPSSMPNKTKFSSTQSSNQYNEFIIDNDESHNQQIWRTTDDVIYQKPNIQHQQYEMPFNAKKQPMDIRYKNPQIHPILYRQPGHSSKTLSTTTTSSNLPNPSTNPQIIYDEFLNPIIVGQLPAQMEITSDLTTPVASNSNYDDMSKKSKFFQYEEQQKQMIWIPRDDIMQTEMPTSYQQTTSNCTKVYNANQHKPQYAPVIHPQSHQISSDLKNASVNNPAFTIRRQIVQSQEETKQIEALKKIIESNLSVQMSGSCEEVSQQLADGVILCHLMNQIYPHSILPIHVPATSMAKLSIAKCRKNVEMFIESCHRLGIDKAEMCSVHDILEAKNIALVSRTVIMVASYMQYCQQNMNYQAQSDYNSLHQSAGNESSSLQQQQTAV